MNNQELQKTLMEKFKEERPTDQESAMVIVREILKDYPRQLQQFGDWFNKNCEHVLKMVNG